MKKRGGRGGAGEINPLQDGLAYLFENRLYEVLENLSDGVILYDKDDRFVMCNQAYRLSMSKIADKLVPDTHVEEVIRAIVENSLFEEAVNNPESFFSKRLAEFKKGRAPTEYKTTDGRWFLISDNKSPSGETMVIRTDITEIKRAQEALIESERRAHSAERKATDARDQLMDAFESIPAMMALYDKDDKFVLCNQPYRQTLHKIADKLVPGVSFQEISHAGAERGMVEGYQGQPEEWVRLRNERFHSSHDPVLHRQQDGRWVLTADHKTRDGGTLIIRTDVTALKQAENAVRETEERFRRSQELSHIATWDRNVLTGELFWSHETSTLLGYAAGSLQPSLETLMAAIHPDDRDRAQRALQACIANKTSQDIEYRVVWPDGTVHWLHEIGDVILGENGEVIRFSGVLRDVTPRKTTEDQLRKLFRAVEQSPNAIFVTDTRGTIEFVNQKFVELTGYSKPEAMGQNPRLLKSDQTPPEVYADLWSTIKAGKVWRGEIMDRAKDGTDMWVSETIAPMMDESGVVTHYIATHEDITARKQGEEALRVALNQADIANRAKTELLANMSHELRTPLNAIIGFSDAIRQQIFGPMGNAKYEEYIGHIASSGQHLLELINDILDVSAIEAGKLTLNESLVEVGRTVEATLELVRHRAHEGGIRLSSEVSAELGQLYADERRLKQILLNLLTNAIKFTLAGGRVTLTVAPDDKGRCVFTVSDTGIGMSLEEQGRAMTMFGQVDSGLARKQEGTGLGLPLTQGLVDLHGGLMEIDSAKGKGTRITVRLPADRVR